MKESRTRDFCLVCGKWVDEHDPEERVVCIENWGRYRNYEAAENRIRDLEAHVVKAYESEDRATQAAERAEARLAEAERLLQASIDVLYDVTLRAAIHDFLSDPAGRESGAQLQEAEMQHGTARLGPDARDSAAANSGGDYKEAAR